MRWVRIDDNFPENPKTLRVGAFGAWMHLQAICYSSRNLTDGFVPSEMLRAFARTGIALGDGSLAVMNDAGLFGQGNTLDDLDWTAMMIDAGLWERAENGIVVHDYAEYQSSKEEILTKRRAARQRMVKMRRLRSRELSENFPGSSPEVRLTTSPHLTSPEKKKKTGRGGVFTPPTLDEICSYVRERGYHFNPEAFHAFYASKGWKVGASPMKSWESACVTWEQREPGRASPPTPPSAPADEEARSARLRAQMEEMDAALPPEQRRFA